jgi:AcrR family transcriptional regulator
MANEPTPSGPGRRIRGLDAEQRRLRRRSQLLDAALDQFAAHGYHRTSIEQICRVAFVSTKSFYESFESREACYIALLQRSTEQIAGAVAAQFQDAPESEADAEQRIIAAFAHALVDDPRFARVTFGGAGGISPAVEAQRRTNRRWAAGFLQEIWAYYGATAPETDGDASTADIQSVAIGTIGGLFDIVADWLQDSDPADAGAVDDLIERLTAFYRVLRAGLEPSSAG